MTIASLLLRRALGLSLHHFIIMTSPTLSGRRAARPTRRFVRGVVAIATVSVLALPSADAAAASPRTHSTAVAVQAQQALDAFDQWERLQDPTDYVRYVRARELTAILTAIELDMPSGALSDEWATVPLDKQQVVLAAMSQLGVPYESIAAEPGVGFDCSGLTSWAFAEAGIEIPRVSRDQIADARDVDHSAARPGDLVYYPGHVSLYLGADTMVHAPNSGNFVEAVRLPHKSLRFGDVDAPDDQEPPFDVSVVSDDAALMDRTTGVAQ
ncbi:MAG: C40 family peptidase [Ilumatobacteraceae bacterium]